MSKLCEECGHQLNEYDKECPNCGCPVEESSSSENNDFDVLNIGKSNDAETVISTFVDNILKVGNILAIIQAIFVELFFILLGCTAGPEEAFILGIVGIPFAFLTYYFVKWLVKLRGAFIVLFFNISTTLKRIELILNNYGSN